MSIQERTSTRCFDVMATSAQELDQVDHPQGTAFVQLYFTRFLQSFIISVCSDWPSQSEGFSYSETRWLSVLRGLTHLNMAHCPSAECARALSCLKYLSMKDGVTEGQAKSLSRLTRLDWRCQKHTAPQSCMRNVQSMQGLKHFYYEGSSIYGLEHFSSLTRLTTLHLCETWVVHNYAEDADRLSTLTALHDLNIRYSVQLEIPGPIQTMQLIKVNHTSGPHVSIVRVA